MVSFNTTSLIEAVVTELETIVLINTWANYTDLIPSDEEDYLRAYPVPLVGVIAGDILGSVPGQCNHDLSPVVEIVLLTDAVSTLEAQSMRHLAVKADAIRQDLVKNDLGVAGVNTCHFVRQERFTAVPRTTDSEGAINSWIGKIRMYFEYRVTEDI